MESTLATEMSESQRAQLNEILDRCLADLQSAHAQLVREEALFRQTQAEMAAFAARSEREKLDVEQILRTGQVDSPFH